MASTKFEVSMEIFKFQGEPDVSVTLNGKSPAELNTALKTLETIAKTTTLYDGDSAPEHPEAHMGSGQALLHDVRRAG